jgi:hypothetical protein
VILGIESIHDEEGRSRRFLLAPKIEPPNDTYIPRRRITLLCLAMWLLSPTAIAAADTAQNYHDDSAAIEVRRKALASQWKRAPSKALEGKIEQEFISSFHTLTRHWLGTRWALGSPQTKIPGQGKVNCVTFVGRVLRDAGFNLAVRKLQRQPSQLIIKSFLSFGPRGGARTLHYRIGFPRWILAAN